MDDAATVFFGYETTYLFSNKSSHRREDVSDGLLLADKRHHTC